MSTYTPTPVELGDITLPADGQKIQAVDVNVPFEACADGIAFVGQELDAEIARAIAAEDAIRPGRLLSRTVLGLSGASGTHTTGANTNKMRIRGVGAGGGGGGCPSAAGASSGGGAGAGSYVELTFDCDPSTGYAWTRGAAGTASSASAGGGGGDSTFDANGTTVTAKGGGGGNVGVGNAAVSTTLGGTGGGPSLNGDINGVAAPGDAGIVFLVATPVGVGGKGASSIWGAGGRPCIAAGDGNAAGGYGAGGGGALTGASSARTGGVGTIGLWIVEEYS